MKKGKKMKNKIIEIDYLNNLIKLYENNICVKKLENISIGKNGLTNSKKEGDLCTPKGTYNLGFAFGTMDKKFEYPYYKIDDKYYWVDDIKSPFYNQLVMISDKASNTPYDYFKFSNQVAWTTAEHLIDYPIEYELGLVIEFNIKPCIPGKGSAIFFHLQKGNKNYTAGCIATTKDNLLYIINWLGKDKGKITIK